MRLGSSLLPGKPSSFVLVKTLFSTTTLPPQHGDLGPFKLNEPMILGHEASGIVTEVGKNVTHLSLGDHVCMEPGVPDVTSIATLKGMYNLDPKLRFWATPPYASNLLAGRSCLPYQLCHDQPQFPPALRRGLGQRTRLSPAVCRTSWCIHL